MKHANAIGILRDANAACRLTDDELAAVEKDIATGSAVARGKFNLDDRDWSLHGAGEDPRSSAWVTVGNVSLHLVRKEHSVLVAAYPLGSEMNDPLADFMLWFSAVQVAAHAGTERAPS